MYPETILHKHIMLKDISNKVVAHVKAKAKLFLKMGAYKG